MELIFVHFTFLYILKSSLGHILEDSTTNRTVFIKSCPKFMSVEHGSISLLENELNYGFQEIAHIECDIGYDLVGPPKILCINGEWEEHLSIQCVPRCQPPPHLDNGNVQIEGGSKDENGLYHKGTLVTYMCNDEFELSPPESKYRVCEKGIWTGAVAVCKPIKKITGCKAPKDIANGYFVHEKFEIFDGYNIGQRLHYSCNSGYILVGSPIQQCIDDGTWSPKIPPICSDQITDITEDSSCVRSPIVPHSGTTVVQGYQSAESAISGTIVEIRCYSKYRNSRSPCKPSYLRCTKGEWVGILPVCVPAKECLPPPTVTHGTAFDLRFLTYESGLSSKYPIKSQISYQCLPGFDLEGSEILTCSPGGCWTPSQPPVCRNVGKSQLEINATNAILVSGATGAGVLGILLIICLVVVCRKRKPISRGVPLPPPIPRPDLGDHAALLNHPDRLALIAFADGVQSSQSALPTYEEATRDRGPGLTVCRLQRPHWPALMTRRSRNSPNPDMVHVTRQGSFASHTPSTRSGGDSMGSTDTMAISEGSTTVTLDTASSHSGSQAPSCRVHCGSLASFDTSSVLNTEGVPLLEENELEEVQGDTVSLAMENRSMTDSSSLKFGTASLESS